MEEVKSAEKHHSVRSDEAPPDPKAHGLFAALRRTLPAGEVIRFLLVGASNTVIGFGLYSAGVVFYSRLFTHASKPLIAGLASVTSKPVSITIAFLCYKHFVFRTRGNYLKEWLRCFAVYGVSIPIELAIVYLATQVFLLFALTHPYAPFLAGIVNSTLIAGYSYFAHKKFSFKR